MQISEQEIEDYLFVNKEELENLGILRVIDQENGLKQKIYRQVDLNPYGIADIIAVNSYLDPKHYDANKDYGDDHKDAFQRVFEINVVELKACPLEPKHFSQLARYIHALKDLDYGYYDCTYGVRDARNYRIDISGWVIAQKPCTNNDVIYMEHVLKEDIHAIYYTYSLANGIQFDQLDSENWYKVDNKTNDRIFIDRTVFDDFITSFFNQKVK